MKAELLREEQVLWGRICKKMGLYGSEDLVASTLYHIEPQV